MNTTRRSIVSAAFFMILGHAVLAQIPDAAGHWGGVVTADLGKIHFALDLARRQDGGWIGTYSQPAQGLVGLPWSVVAIEGAGRQLRLLLTIANQPDGTAAATIARLDEGLTLPVHVTQAARSVTIGARDTGASFAGTLDPESSALTGTFAEGPITAPLTFRRAGR